MYKRIDKNALRVEKHHRIRNKISGTPDKPRLNIFRSNKHIYAQIIDDQAGTTLVSVSTLDPQLKKDLEDSGNAQAAKKVGMEVAARATAKGITKVVFDRGGYIYHGRVKALADGAREGGLEF